MLFARKKLIRASLHSLKDVSSTSMKATAVEILLKGNIDVGTVLLYFFRTLFLIASFNTILLFVCRNQFPDLLLGIFPSGNVNLGTDYLYHFGGYY